MIKLGETPFDVARGVEGFTLFRRLADHRMRQVWGWASLDTEFDAAPARQHSPPRHTR